MVRALRYMLAARSRASCAYVWHSLVGYVSEAAHRYEPGPSMVPTVLYGLVGLISIVATAVLLGRSGWLR